MHRIQGQDDEHQERGKEKCPKIVKNKRRQVEKNKIKSASGEVKLKCSDNIHKGTQGKRKV